MAEAALHESGEPRPMQGIKRQHSFAHDDPSSPDKRQRLDAPTAEPVQSDVPPRHQGVATWLEGVGDCHPVPDRDGCSSASPITPHPREPVQYSNLSRHGTPSSWFPTPRATGSLPPETPGQQSEPGSPQDFANHPQYREVNLRAHNIHLKGPCDSLPQDVASLIHQLKHGMQSTALDPTMSEIESDQILQSLSLGIARKPMVAKIFTQRILPRRHPFDVYSRSFGASIPRLPGLSTASSPWSPEHQYPLSTAAPDILYGYELHNSFSETQRRYLSDIGAGDGVRFPFLLVECTGDDTGTMYTATNRCLGGAATCLQAAEDINLELSQYAGSYTGEVAPVDDKVFSIATNGTEARLYISWKRLSAEDEACYTAIVKCFLLQDPQHYLDLRRMMRGIIDWGKGRRLERIRGALSVLARLTESDSHSMTDGL
ncbi:uncharacterized protein B0I36DRAFT_319395 [Microdochium trichocladiopsis]|uniref:DUF7924 domain-containing protein n=1 Tax=Microdochium trichocladiopsis TaxID=1682393 RepID=A0A9P8YDB2_9PEZI|nr:uncharacterized protein B0I36DRAFT_319395 [Microdochium trichocladiopsis]KAH7035934.1 hypothetical protein B0I36DRAFT_319395 [Microdochium trichocladiopsis]